MHEIKNQFLAELANAPADLIASIWIFDRIPHIFEANLNEYANWRRSLAQQMGVDASAIFITGSAAFGISLNPHKNYKFFDHESDIDVAVVSEYHFTEAWRTLRKLGSKRLGLTRAQQSSVNAHVERYIYWGTFATDRLLPILPFADQWKRALDDASLLPQTSGREIKARIYRDLDSLRAYQVNNLDKLKTAYLERES